MTNDDPDYVPDPPKDTKWCPKCEKFKPKTEFWQRGTNAKYRHSYCKQCHSDTFKYEKIVCPHCSGRLCFFGIDKDSKVIQQKATIINKLKKDTLKESVKESKKTKKKPVKNLKDLFDV